MDSKEVPVEVKKKEDMRSSEGADERSCDSESEYTSRRDVDNSKEISPNLDVTVSTKSIIGESENASNESLDSLDIEIPPKGRRGDPRMHKAVALRLEHPNMSLQEALLNGGFKFPDLYKGGHRKSDRLINDSQGVSLCQRKNQLSRRLRLARKREPERSNNPLRYSLGSAAGYKSSVLGFPYQQMIVGNVYNTIREQISPAPDYLQHVNFSNLSNPITRHDTAKFTNLHSLNQMRRAGQITANEIPSLHQRNLQPSLQHYPQNNLPLSLLERGGLHNDVLARQNHLSRNRHQHVSDWRDDFNISETSPAQRMTTNGFQPGLSNGDTRSSSLNRDVVNALPNANSSRTSAGPRRIQSSPPSPPIVRRQNQDHGAKRARTNSNDVDSSSPQEKLELALKHFNAENQLLLQQCLVQAGFDVSEIIDHNLVSVLRKRIKST